MTEREVYRDGRVHVRAVPCDRCLFSADRLVSGERAREIVRATRETPGGSSFVCHKSQVSDEVPSICATWWERFAMEQIVFRLAVAYGIVERVGGPE